MSVVAIILCMKPVSQDIAEISGTRTQRRSDPANTSTAPGSARCKNSPACPFTGGHRSCATPHYPKHMTLQCWSGEWGAIHFLYLRKCSPGGVFLSTQRGRQKLSRARECIGVSKLGPCPSQPRQKASLDWKLQGRHS